MISPSGKIALNRLDSALGLAVLHRKTPEQVIKLHSLDGRDCLLIDAALVANPEVNMLFFLVLVEKEVAVTIIELTPVPLRNRDKLEVLNSPQASLLIPFL